MIIFYDKKTGVITGTIDGRIHTEAQLNTWVGNPKDTDKIVVQYKPVNEHEEIQETEIVERYVRKVDGFDYPRKRIIRQKVKVTDFEPDSKQKELFIAFDKKKENPLDYKVSLKSKQLIKVK